MAPTAKSRDTKIELIVRSELHRRGFRFRVQKKELPGRPDLYLRKYKAVIQVHGCFWHHHNCHLGYLPKSRIDFWQKKFETNIARDRAASRKLRDMGFRVAVVWECALRNQSNSTTKQLFDCLSIWLTSEQSGTIEFRSET